MMMPIISTKLQFLFKVPDKLPAVWSLIKPFDLASWSATLLSMASVSGRDEEQFLTLQAASHIFFYF